MKSLLLCALVLFFSINCFAGEKITAAFKADKQTGPLPLSVLFEGLEETPGVFYTWDFGNGSTSLRKATTTMFVNPGTYRVKLTVTNGLETDSSVMSIEVLPNPDYVRHYRSKTTAQEQ